MAELFISAIPGRFAMAKRQRGRRVPPAPSAPPVIDDDEPGLFDEPLPERPPLQRVVAGIPAEMDADSLDTVLSLMAQDDAPGDTPDSIVWVFEHDLCPVRAWVTDQGVCVLSGRFTAALDAIAVDIRERCHKEVAAARQVVARFVVRVHSLCAAAHQHVQGRAVVLNDDYFAGQSFEEALGQLLFDYNFDIILQPCAETLLFKALWRDDPAEAAWLVSVIAAYWEGYGEGHAMGQGTFLSSPDDAFVVAPVASVRAGACFWLLEEGGGKTIGRPYLRLDMVQKDGTILGVDTATWRGVALVPEGLVAILPEVAEETQE